MDAGTGYVELVADGVQALKVETAKITSPLNFTWFIGPAGFSEYQDGEVYANTALGIAYPVAVNGIMVGDLDVPYQLFGGTVVLDQITIYYYTDASADDFDFSLIKTDNDGTVTVVENQVDIGNGATGYGSQTCLAGDITLTAFGYWVEIDVNNVDANSDVRICSIKFDGHLE